MILTHLFVRLPLGSYTSLCGHDQPGDSWTSDRAMVECIYCQGKIADQLQEERAKMKNAKLDRAKTLRDTAEKLTALAATLEDEAKKESPPEPDRSRGNMFQMAVMFKPGSKVYTYLILRTTKFPQSGYKYFTTGTGDTGMFDSWEEFVAWIEGGKVYGHGALISLGHSEPRQAYKFGNKYK